MEWLWQGLVTHGAYALLILASGALLGILKAKKPELAAPALYGIAGIACLAVIWFAFTGRAVISAQQPQTTPENVEANIRSWADGFGLGVTRGSVPNSSFSLVVTLHNGNPVIIARTNDRPTFLQLQTPLSLSSEHSAALSKLSKDEQQKITQEIVLELARSRVGYVIAAAQTGPQLYPGGITISKPVPIAGLNDATFAQAMDDMDNGITLVRATMALAIDYNQPHGLAKPPAAR